MKYLTTFFILFFIALSVNAQQTTADIKNQYSEGNNTSIVKDKSESLYNLDLQNYFRVRKADRIFFVPHTRKLKLELDIKRSFFKVGKKGNSKLKLA